MVNISERKVTIYLPAGMQKKLVTLAQKNKLKNLRRGIRREEKLPETMGAIVREALKEYFEEKKLEWKEGKNINRLIQTKTGSVE
ncbi:hypothetical protein HQ584_11105 [Patescibacteria group bacterium]|nr:hypothetical protein [Patescibacteria group bacterium]